MPIDQADAKKASAAAEANLMAMQDKLDTMQKELAASQEAQKVAQAKLDDLEDAIQRETAPLKVRLNELNPSASVGSASLVAPGRSRGETQGHESVAERHGQSIPQGCAGVCLGLLRKGVLMGTCYQGGLLLRQNIRG